MIVITKLVQRSTIIVLIKIFKDKKFVADRTGLVLNHPSGDLGMSTVETRDDLSLKTSYSTSSVK